MNHIIKAISHDDRTIEIEYSDGLKGSFNFEDYFNYQGNLSPLQEIIFFKNVSFDGPILKWNNDIDLCPDITRSIISQEKIVIDGKIVFDPSLKKNAWIEN